MKLIQFSKLKLCMMVLVPVVMFNACNDSSTSAVDDEEMGAISYVAPNVASNMTASNSSNIIIDSFTQGSQQINGAYPANVNLYNGVGPIGGLRELYAQENHPVTTTHSISGSTPGVNRISWSNGYGATIQELRYGKCIDPSPVRSNREAAFTHALAECTNPNSPELNADFKGIGGFEIDFQSLVGYANGSYWRVVVVMQTETGKTFRYDNATVPENASPFTLSMPFDEFSSEPTDADLADVDGIVVTMSNNGNKSGERDIAFTEIRAIQGTNVYVSNSSVQTWDPVFPSSADPNWSSTVCYQSNDFGITANWVNPHNAFEVTQDNGQPHPWDNSTFDAAWINSYNDMDSEGPGGHNWSKYETEVTGNGDFVVQLLADNCSWVYLADENGDNPQLIGYQPSVSTPGEYGVTLDGTHKLTFVIFDGGGLAGGKFRLETTESFGGTPPPPIEPDNNAPNADAGSDQSITATGSTTSVTLDGSASSDPDGDDLTYSWSDGSSIVSTEASFTTSLPDGEYTFTLTVSDGEESDTDEVTVEVVNTIPVADAGDDITKEATGPTTSVTLNGSATDADGDELTYAWSNGDPGASTTVSLGVGSHTFTLTVTDEQGATDSDEVTVEITDTTAPELSFNQETASLWPPNHKMVLVASGISASDIVDGTTNVMVEVSSNEPSNGKGDGNTDSDYEIVTNFDGSIDVYLRAERSGKGKGRTYTVSLSTSDAAGNVSATSFEASVAKSQGRAR